MAKRRWLWFGGAAIAAVLAVWAFSVSSRQMERNQRIEDEVSSLESEAEKIRRENETLREKINYFSSDDFREQEAKKKLGLKKAEETVVVIKPGAVYDGDTGTLVKSVDIPTRAGDASFSSQIGKWKKVFFGAR